MDSEKRVASALEELRKHGARITSDRIRVLEALSNSAEHVTAEQLADRIGSESPEVSRATVYRTLELLETCGIVTHSHLGHGPSFWHFKDEIHHHLVCECCGHSIEIPSRIFDPLALEIARDTGFELDPFHFSLTGTCKECQGKTSTSKS